MNRCFSAAALLYVLAAVGCAPALVQPKAESDAKTVAPAAPADSQDVKTGDDVESEAAKDAAVDAEDGAKMDIVAAVDNASPAPWGAGDFVVYRFTGSFHKSAVTLTERVVARQGDTFTLDVTYDDGKTKESIRAHMKGDSPAKAEVLRVARLVKGAEQPAAATAYEDMLARVALVADQNEARLSSETVKVQVTGHGSVACEKTTFRVKVGNETATMRTLESAAFAWGDLGAEITTAAGKLIYKAEIVDAGHDAPKTPAVASADDEY
ncbi:MAG: hypothetical protein IPK82_37270 [Polyangiaceae bacterium]|nr:hypothetical protein [Polyangiaceae bacterium]